MSMLIIMKPNLGFPGAQIYNIMVTAIIWELNILIL